MESNILIIEDDDSINNMICEAMKLAGFSCIQAFSGTEGMLRIENGNIDLVILDLMLPGKSGEEVIKEIKERSDIPVIVVSAKDSVDSKIDLLRLGADDYLTKPFDIKELTVRVEVRLRRFLEAHGRRSDAGYAKKPDDSAEGSIFYKELELNPDSFFVKVNNNPVDLTKHEFRILELLVKNPGQAFSKQAIYDYAWDDIYIGEDKTVNVHISNIRKKLKAFSDREYIDTVWGIGFKLTE